MPEMEVVGDWFGHGIVGAVLVSQTNLDHGATENFKESKDEIYVMEECIGIARHWDVLSPHG